MRCPRCLERWDPDHVDLDAEHAECRPCGLVVALLGVVLPEWGRDGVASRLDRVGAVPPLDDVVVSESQSPRVIEARGAGSFWRGRSRVSLGRDGAREKRPFRAPVVLPLGRVERVVPAVSFEWERDTRQGRKWLVATPLVSVVLSGDTGASGPALEVGSWDAARYVGARFEVVRRALTETGIYR